MSEGAQMTEATPGLIRDLVPAATTVLGVLVGWFGAYLSHRRQAKERREDARLDAYAAFLGAFERFVTAWEDYVTGMKKLAPGIATGNVDYKAHLQDRALALEKASVACDQAQYRVLLLEKNKEILAAVEALAAPFKTPDGPGDVDMDDVFDAAAERRNTAKALAQQVRGSLG